MSHTRSSIEYNLSHEFMQCVEKNNAERVKELLEVDPSLCYMTNEVGQEPIHIAAEHACIDVIKILVKYHVDINKLSVSGKAALHFAVESGNVEMVAFITNLSGINLNIQTHLPNTIDHGMTPVFLASYLNNVDIAILKLLVSKGADTSIATSNGQTPLSAALWWRHADRVRIILATKNVNINSIIDGNCATALTNAVERYSSDMVQEVLAVEGISTIINFKNNSGESALFIAARYGDPAKLKLLLAVPGIDIEAKRIPGDGKTALEIAKETKPSFAAKLIQDKIQERLQIKYPYVMYAKTMHKVPNKKLYENYLQDIKEAERKNKNLTSTEVEFVKSRIIHSNLYSDCDRFNTEYRNANNIKQNIINRFKKLGYTEHVEKLYQDCIDCLKYNSAIVMTIDLSFLNTIGLSDYRPLNIFERDVKKGANYIPKRDATERDLFQFIRPDIQNALFNNKHARPRYAALVLLDKHHGIEPLTFYGDSYIVFDDIVKFNSLYNSCDAMAAKYNLYKNLIPCTYQNLDFILYQCQDLFLEALLHRVTTGQLPLGYSQQYYDNPAMGGYIEVMLPPVDLFDKKISKKFFIHQSEYVLKNEEKVFFEKLGISVTNSNQNPYSAIRNEFMNCVEHNRAERVKEILITYPSLVHMTDEFGQEPIHVAAERACIDVIKILVKYHVDINKLSVTGKAALHFAVESGNVEMVAFISNLSGIILNIQTHLPHTIDHGMTPIFLASYLNNVDIAILKLLIAKGADTSIAASNGQTPLSAALWWRHADRVRIILATKNVNINSIIGGNCATALTNAVEQCSFETVQNVLAVKGMVNTINFKNNSGESALFIAVKQGDLEKVKLLLAVPGIDIEAKRIPGDGKSALEVAKEMKHGEVVKLIQQKQLNNEPTQIIEHASINNVLNMPIEPSQNYSTQTQFNMFQPEYESQIGKNSIVNDSEQKQTL